MKGKRYTEQQILDILGQVDAGQPLAEITRLHGVAASPIHRWKNRYGRRTKDETKQPSSAARGASTTQETGR
ncbi:transposase [Deinococcus oregonensis]|uniref:Transposase n=1 Tax=Deinococcus oregonensis TaxID=1805970 RepID=A0ABV6AVV4_9DEIO